MKIASVCTLYPTRTKPHAGVFVQRRLEALARLAEVRLLKPVPWFPLLRRPRRFESAAGAALSPRVLVRPMFYIPGVLKGLDGRWLRRAVLPVLRQWREEQGVELIDAHFGYPEGVGCVQAAGRLGLPVFVTLRGSEASYLRDAWIGPQLVAALRACTGIVAVSHSLKQAVESAGVDAAKVRVIPNAVDDTVFHPSDRDLARGRLKLPANKQVIISVGQLVHRKGHHTLLKAFALLRRKRPRVELVIVGGRSYERSYPSFVETLARDLGVADAVRLVGALPPGDVARWLQAADVFALATQREGCCNAVLEALACGLPVVTTEAGDNAVYVDSPRNGLIAAMEDPEAFADALEIVMGNVWDADAIARRVTGKGWHDVAESVLGFFEERLGSSHPLVSTVEAAS